MTGKKLKGRIDIMLYLFSVFAIFVLFDIFKIAILL